MYAPNTEESEKGFAVFGVFSRLSAQIRLCKKQKTCRSLLAKRS